MNSTHFPYFVLAAYLDAGPLRYFFFLVLLLLYVSIVCANVLLILVICMNRSLHEPMYVFLCSLFVNELYGSTGLFPFLLVQLLSDLHLVSSSLCFLQIFCLYSYGSVEFFTLAVMSYDRYLAICRPLRYRAAMTSQRVAVLVAVVWLPSCAAVVVSTSLTRSLRPCGNVINKVYCNNHSVIKLSCSDSTLVNAYELVALFPAVLAPLLVILYFYARILRVCFSSSSPTRHKALSTCAPHLATLLNFSCGVSFEILQSRFNVDALSKLTRVFLSLYFLTCQPLFSPLMYGLNLSKIRLGCKRMIGASCNKCVQKLLCIHLSILKFF